MGQGYFHLPLLPFHGDSSQRTEVSRKDEKLRETEPQGSKIQTAKMICHFPTVSRMVMDISRTGFWVSTSEHGS